MLKVKVKLFIGANKMAQLRSKYVDEIDSRKTRLKDKVEKGVKLHPLKNLFSDLGEYTGGQVLGWLPDPIL